MRSNVARAKRKIFNDFFFLFVPLWGDFVRLGFQNEKILVRTRKSEKGRRIIRGFNKSTGSR